MSKKSIFLASVAVVLTFQGVFAFEPKETSKYFNGPTVKVLSSTSANVSLSQAVLAGMTAEEKAGVYFQYYETRQVCIMIYPTPEHCLPKKTEVGKSDVTITNLKPAPSYTVVYKRANTIQCITTPCPGNEFESLSVEFVTKSVDGGSGGVIKDTPSGKKNVTGNLSYRTRGEQVMLLQTMLIEKGYMTGEATGFFGVVTLKAVKDFQRANNITPTGFVGPLTRAQLMKISATLPGSVGEKFEGAVTAYSTACFADGECSVTVDGKKVVTTIGWSQAIVGKVTGIPDFGSIENNIGAHAKVYAKKTEDGYTLYGSSDYYIHISRATTTQGKLPAGSAPAVDSKAVQAHTWVWQKTVMTDTTTVTPNKTGVFTLTFGKEGNLSGKTDCNGFFGSYTFGSDGFIKFGPLGSTMMYCEGSQEQVFTSAIAKVDRYSMDASGNLILLLSGNDGSIYFTKK